MVRRKEIIEKIRKEILPALGCMTLGACLLSSPAVAVEETVDESDWVTFCLVCNEGMSSRGGNSGNTMMITSMNTQNAQVRLMMFTSDTFINYEGYDLPQKIDMAYRNAGPEETMRVFNDNFGTDIERFLSLNYLNLATLIDAFGGVTVDITRAERNALNGMVSSKKENIQAMEDANLLSQMLVEMLAQEYYLNEFGPDTHLNGLQAVAFGWLQYDSVYNCCEREVEVIASLFRSVGSTLHEEVVLYDDDAEVPDIHDGRRLVNLDHISEEDRAFLMETISPIFETSYHNLTEDEIYRLALTLGRVAYKAAEQGADVLDQLVYTILPLEAEEPYVVLAGAEGHLIDYEANAKAIKQFLYGEEVHG